MRLLIYAREGGGAARRLETEVRGLDSCGLVDWSHDLEHLCRLLRTTRHADTIGLILAFDSSELAALLQMKELFRDIPLVVILPDRDAETVSKGYGLAPRYLDFLDGDLGDVAEIVRRMMGKKSTSRWNVDTKARITRSGPACSSDSGREAPVRTPKPDSSDLIKKTVN